MIARPIRKLKPGTDEPLFECRKMASDFRQHPGVVVKSEDLFIAAGHYNPGVKLAIQSWGEPAQQELWNLVRERQITHESNQSNQYDRDEIGRRDSIDESTQSAAQCKRQPYSNDTSANSP
jgi:hypothetical protein